MIDEKYSIAGAVVVVGALIVVAACGPDFTPAWRVDKYRILAVKANPVTLKEDETATLSVLDHAPDGVDATYSWSWCPLRTSASNKFECPFDALQRALEEADGEPAPSLDPEQFDLGSGPTAGLEYPGTQEQILGLCRAIQQAVAEAGQGSPIASLLPTVNCDRGFDVTVRLEVQTDTYGDRVVSKELTLFTGSDQVNENPRLTNLSIRVKRPGDIPKVVDRLDWVDSRETPREDQWYTMPVDEPTPVIPGIPFEMLAEVNPDSVETWRPPAPAGSDRETLPPEREILTFSWYVVAGDIDRANSIFREDLNTLDVAGGNTWNVSRPVGSPCPPPEQGESEEVSRRCDRPIWALVRDGRLGLDWVEREVRILDQQTGD
jgi:hypothetical protein